MFLSTPPSRVATPWLPHCRRRPACFYPRHPRGWRQPPDRPQAPPLYVSIHATLAGGDLPAPAGVLSGCLFLSTPPSRVATGDDLLYMFPIYGFYPRHPRGWRLLVLVLHSHQQVVSIHATLAGGDIPQSPPPAPYGRFYPRHPRGWRRGALLWKHTRGGVSIHATLAGGDSTERPVAVQQQVSIHATLAGGDDGSPVTRCTPLVSIHATLAGGDRLPTTCRKKTRKFLSTPPSRVATHETARQRHRGHVSIHATLAGGDVRLFLWE